MVNLLALQSSFAELRGVGVGVGSSKICFLVRGKGKEIRERSLGDSQQAIPSPRNRRCFLMKWGHSKRNQLVFLIFSLHCNLLGKIWFFSPLRRGIRREREVCEWKILSGCLFCRGREKEMKGYLFKWRASICHFVYRYFFFLFSWTPEVKRNNIYFIWGCYAFFNSFLDDCL